MTTQQQVLDRLERRADRFEALVSRSLRRAIRAGTRELGQVLTAAITPEPTPPPEEPVSSAFVSLDDLAAIEAAWRTELRDVIIPELANIVTDGAQDVLADLADDADVPLERLVAEVPVLIDGRNPAAEIHLLAAENRLAGIGNDLWQKTRMQLTTGLAEGESIPKLARRVREELAVTAVRAKTIARTEVISASNAGAISQVRNMAPEFQPVAKTWLATNDNRTRLTHRAADGQTVPLGEEFEVGGAMLDFPGDPDGPADEVINCRCTILWELPDDVQED